MGYHSCALYKHPKKSKRLCLVPKTEQNVSILCQHPSHFPSPPISFGPVLFGSDPDSAPASKGINSKASGRVSSSVGKRRMFFKRVLGSGYNSWRPGVGGWTLNHSGGECLEERRDTPSFNPNDTKSTRNVQKNYVNFNQDTWRLVSILVFPNQFRYKPCWIWCQNIMRKKGEQNSAAYAHTKSEVSHMVGHNDHVISLHFQAAFFLFMPFIEAW